MLGSYALTPHACKGDFGRYRTLTAALRSVHWDPADSRKLLTLAEAAKLRGISVGHLSRVISAGQLPVVKLSTRVVRIAPADLDAYIESRRESR